MVVPRNKIALFVKYANTLEEKFKVRIRSFGHAGDGNLHIYVCRDDLLQEPWENKRDAVMAALYEKAIELSGQVSGEHGIGHAKIPFLEESVGDDTMALIRGIKKAFDPNNILNRKGFAADKKARSSLFFSLASA